MILNQSKPYMSSGQKDQFESSILVVDEEGPAAFSIEESLLELGYKNIDVALDSEIVKNKLSSNNYDLIILDINLRNKYNGIELAEQIKKDNEDLSVMFLAENPDNLIVSKANATEPSAFLIKPFNIAQLKVSLDLIFHQKSPESQLTKKATEAQFSKSLLNHLPDLIVRLSLQGEILFVNQLISRLTGKQAQEYNGKNLVNSDFDPDFILLLTNCIETVLKKKRKYVFEHDTNTFLGERMFFTVVIPEFDKSAEIQAVTLILQDRTDEKIATKDLTQRHKKMTDSINYSTVNRQ
jgi:PAS domain S-box-containing protein